MRSKNLLWKHSLPIIKYLQYFGRTVMYFPSGFLYLILTRPKFTVSNNKLKFSLALRESKARCLHIIFDVSIVQHKFFVCCLCIGCIVRISSVCRWKSGVFRFLNYYPLIRNFPDMVMASHASLSLMSRNIFFLFMFLIMAFCFSIAAVTVFNVVLIRKGKAQGK